MKSSPLLPLFLFLASTQAVTIPRSQHDTMLERNFKNVYQGDPSKSHLVARSPQGPASNPGEFTNVGLSNLNPENQNSASGSSSSSSSNTGSEYVPQPVMDSSSSSSALDTPSSAASSTVPDLSSDSSGNSDGSVSDSAFAMPSGSRRHHHHPSGSGYPPMPTGGHHRHRNETRPHHDKSNGVVEVDMEIQPDGEVDISETLWQFNGTGWNSTNIPLPSGTVIGTLVPMATGGYSVSTGGGAALPTGTGAPGFENGNVKPGFTGPREDLSTMEIANDGTGRAEYEKRDVDVGMKREVSGERKRWLSGIF